MDDTWGIVKGLSKQDLNWEQHLLLFAKRDYQNRSLSLLTQKSEANKWKNRTWNLQDTFKLTLTTTWKQLSSIISN